MSEGRAVPKQQRGITTRTHIIEAGNTVYEREGRDYFKTQDVQKECGVSIGTIYRYFVNRVDLLDAVMEYRKANGLEKTQEAAPEADSKALAALETIEKIKNWCMLVIEKGEGEGDLKVAGSFMLSEIEKRGL